MDASSQKESFDELKHRSIKPPGAMARKLFTIYLFTNSNHPNNKNHSCKFPS
jgi:hypothetical protein